MAEPLQHPIDAEIRAWIKRLVTNERDTSLAVGRSNSWLHKWVNGDGSATIDDLVRLAAVLMGRNLRALTGLQQKLLDAVDGLDESDQQDVLAYAKHREKLSLARRSRLKESSAPESQTHQGTARKGRGKQKVAG